MSSTAPDEALALGRMRKAQVRATSRAVSPRAGSRTLPHRLGPYTLFDHIGRGGMADIYLAKQETGLGSSRLVVVKEVLAALASRSHFADLLVAEAKLAARLGHANIVKIEDLGRDDGRLYIAMEYVEGFDLRDLLKRCASNRVPLPIEFSLLLVIEALRGLDVAHRHKVDGVLRPIVHCDVSPSNVLVSFDGEVKLCDFGIARAHDAARYIDHTAIEGKAGYMSPEQARGEALDPRADVFAAGIILWELLAGRRLYKACEDERLLEVSRRADIPPLPTRELPREDVLHAIVLRALQRHRDDRYGSAASMLRALEDYAASAQMVASPIRFGEWLIEHFGKDIIGARRGRERALRAFERGPIAKLEAIAVRGSDGVVTPLPPKVAPTLPFVAPEPDPEPVAIVTATATATKEEIHREDTKTRRSIVVARSRGVSVATSSWAPAPAPPKRRKSLAPMLFLFCAIAAIFFAVLAAR